VVFCLECGADLHMSQLMLLLLTVSCFSKIQIGFTFLVPAHLGSPRKRAVKQACVCVCVLVHLILALDMAAVAYIRIVFLQDVAITQLIGLAVGLM